MALELDNLINRADKINTIKSNLSMPSIYEQMAEECSELSQALLKKARKIRNENPTPKTMQEIDKNITEEFTDVILCAYVLDLDFDYFTLDFKLDRWIKRAERIDHVC